MILQYPDPRLKQISSEVEDFGYSLEVLIPKMFDAMYSAGGIGLSAIQINIPKRIFIMNAPDKSPMVFINPVITHSSPILSTHTEGCLSIPSEYNVQISRPESVIISYVDQKNEKHVYVAEGLEATIVQHEMDHLNGILMVER